MIWRSRLLTRRFGNTWQTYNPVTNDWMNLYVSGYDGFDNNGGGKWTKYINIPITSTPSEYAQYKVAIDSTNVTVYAADGTQEAQGAVASDFWDNVQSDGGDMRVFDQAKDQLHFWIESWDYSGQNAVIWVKLPAGSTELNIAYGNPSATKSDYENGEQVFEFFDDFKGNSLDTNKWTAVNNPSLSFSNSIMTISGLNSVSTTPEFIKSLTTFGYDYMLKARVDHDFTGENMGGMGFAEDGGYTYPPKTHVAMYVDMSVSTDALQFITEDGINRAMSDGYTYYGGWTDFIVHRQSNQVYFKFANYEWTSSSALPTKILPVYIGGFESGLTGPHSFNFNVDWVFVAKLADPADFGTPQILEL